MAISTSLVPGTSALSVLTDWRRSPARVHKSPGRAGARPSRGGPFGRHAPRAAQIPRTPSHLPFRSEIPQFTFANEISLRNKVSTSYLSHNSQISEDKIALLALLKNGSHISTPQRNARFHVGTFRHEIAHVQEDVTEMRRRRCWDVTETCGAYTSLASFRVARRAFPHVLWFWTGMGTVEGMGTRDFASERFRREGCNLLRERFFLQFYTSTRPSAQPLDPTTGYGYVAFVPLRLTILDR